jgi:hypothetical protein
VICAMCVSQHRGPEVQAPSAAPIIRQESAPGDVLQLLGKKPYPMRFYSDKLVTVLNTRRRRFRPP